MMKKIGILLTSILASGMLYAATPNSGNNIVQLLTQIAGNTNNTASATSNGLQNALTKIIHNQKAQAAAAHRYLYGSQDNGAFFARNTPSLEAVNASTNTATITFAKTMVDQPLICQNALFSTIPACGSKTLTTLNPYDGAQLLNSNNYTDSNNITQYVKHLFQQNLQSYNPKQISNATLATAVIGNYIEQRIPNKTTGQSFMKQLQQTVTAPTSATWQAQLSQETLSDRLKTIAKLLATQNYLSYLKLETNQKRNVLLAVAILQRVQQSYKNSQMLLQQRISVENQRTIIEILKKK